MVYAVENMMRDVRICLDQNMTSEQLLLDNDVDTLALDDIIKSKLVEAVDRVHRKAPTFLLEAGHNFGDAVYWEDLESGYVLLPQDFMRLTVFKMSDWERPVFEAISSSDPEYALQRQRIKALRGTPQKPVCVLTTRQEGKALEFYSCKTSAATVSQAQYIPYSEIETVDGVEGIDISERCYAAVVYAAASLVLITLGESEKASVLSEMSNSVLQ